MLFFSLGILTVFLVLCEISFVVHSSSFYLGEFKLVANHIKFPIALLPGILYFLFAQLFVHFAFLISIWGFARGAGAALRLSENKIEKYAIVLWFVALFTVLAANRVYFPNSKFSQLLFVPVSILKFILPFLAVFFVILILISCYGFLLPFSRKLKIRLGILSLVFLAGFLLTVCNRPLIMDAGTKQKPNIIIISVDSLRPDFLSFSGYPLSTPHFDRFLNHSTVFSEALTPIARTYSSLMSVVTGEYPKISSLRTNLQNTNDINFSTTLPAILREHGYKTIFATDETRFSNMSERAGFDEMVTPPMGVNDFLVGGLNDFPLSNLIVNTFVGKYLFPHSYGSRAVYVTYDPDTFLKLLRPTLSRSREKPVYLMVHLCLPHYPYAWARLPVNQATVGHYQAAVKRVDKQFYDLMKLLGQNKFLEHGIVILLSDHGEGVEIAGDRVTDPELFISGKNNSKSVIPHFYPPTAEHEKVNKSGGHGTDVLGLSQYHTVLAFRSFGADANQVKVIPGLVSLLDIKPTLLQFLNLPMEKVNGFSLRDAIFGHASHVPARENFFTESDFSPEAIRSVHPEMRKVLFEGIDYFRIDPVTTHVLVRDDMLKMIISSKQYANFDGSWVLALYPQNNKQMMPVLVNLESGQWTNDLSVPFAKKSPARRMLGAMKEFFGENISKIKN